MKTCGQTGAYSYENHTMPHCLSIHKVITLFKSPTVYAIYLANLIFANWDFRQFRKWLNMRTQSAAVDREISSFSAVYGELCSTSTSVNAFLS